MLYDYFIINQISLVNNELSSILEGIDWPLNNEISTDSLSVLQDRLNEIKSIVDNLESHIKNDNQNLKLFKIDYNNHIQNIVLDLTNMANQLNSPIEQNIFDIIIKYITVLCYYSLLNKLLIVLPRDYDDQSYYTTIKLSNLNKFIYLIQTSVSKLFKLCKNNLNQAGFTHLININYNSKFFTKFTLWKPEMMKLFMIQNRQFIGIPKDFIKLNPFKIIKFFIWQQPLHLINNELSSIIDSNSLQLYNQTKKLGYLISLINKGSIDLNRFKSKQLTPNDMMVQNIIHFYQKKDIIPYKKLNFITRYWPIFVTSMIWGPEVIRYCWESRFDLKCFIQKNVIDLINSLIHNWIWLPFKRILATIRHDKSTMIAMVSENTLQSEQDSLIRMIIKFLIDNGVILTEDPSKADTDISNIIINNKAVDNIVKQIEMGQMDQFMTVYENQLSHPVKSIFTGELIRSILIQIQKMKVDGSIAMNGIDKMLKSQELLFGMIALSPSFLLIYSIGSMVNSLIKWGNVWSHEKALRMKIKDSLNNVEQLLNYNYITREDSGNETDNYDDSYYFNLGLLVMEISNLYRLGYELLPKKLRLQWRKDILELINNDFTNEMKLNTINRIYHYYGRLF
ncbi:Nca2p PWA37_000854 [Arxiozyma heterogenica]|uniref:Nca2p n=1 Tax=Arxiozyma heterogenica TaxID=278026 RepID=UPI002EE01894